MREKKQSNILVVIVTLCLIALAAFGVFKLSQTNVFDSTGSYVKDLADDKDTIGFMERSETISYLELLDIIDLEGYKDKAIKYWGYIEEKEIANDKSATYRIKIIMNKEDSAKASKEYSRNHENLALADITVHTPKAYNNFALGDYVYMYGILDNFEETEEGNKIPYFEAKKLVLDTEMEY